jgi:hypothetical protein
MCRQDIKLQQRYYMELLIIRRLNNIDNQYDEDDYEYEDDDEDEDDDDDTECSDENIDKSFGYLNSILTRFTVAWEALTSVCANQDDDEDDEEDEDDEDDDDEDDEYMFKLVKDPKVVLYEPRHARKEYWRKINLRNRRRIYYR